MHDPLDGNEEVFMSLPVPVATMVREDEVI